MHLPWGKIALGILVAVVAFGGALWALNLLWPGSKDQRPTLVNVPPLKPVARNSVIVTPVAIALSAIHSALETAAPRNLAGKRDNPFPQMLSNSELDWTVTRGPLAVAGRSDALVVSTPLSGTFRATGQVSGEAGNLAGAIGGLLGGRLGQGLQNLQGKTLDQRADIRGEVTLAARPSLLPAWRVEPNLTSQVALADASLPVMGVKLSVSNELKPFLDRAVNEQMGALEARLRDDPFLELAARREWAKMCRSISLGAAAAGMPNLWLEAFTATIRSVNLAASGDRLLLSLQVKANENKSWFGLGAEATIHVWGRPVLDHAHQVLRLTDVALDVESQAAFGLLGAAARAAVPYLERAVAENAVVDLVPLAANARKSIDAAISDFRKSADGVRVDAAVTDLRLVGIEFDAKTLRVVTEVDGTVQVAVTKLADR